MTDEQKPVPLWRTCANHGPDKPNVWGCPECLRELREENARLRAAQPAQRLTDAEFEVHESDGFYACTSGPRDDALREARHYAAQCAGAVVIYEVTRTVVEEIAQKDTP